MELLGVDVERRLLHGAGWGSLGRLLGYLRRGLWWLSLLWRNGGSRWCVHGRRDLLRSLDCRATGVRHPPRLLHLLRWHLLRHAVRYRPGGRHVHLLRHRVRRAHLNLLTRRLIGRPLHPCRSIVLHRLHARRRLLHRSKGVVICHAVCWIAGGRGGGQRGRFRDAVVLAHVCWIPVVPHLGHHLVLGHLLGLLVLRVVGLLLGLHDGTCLVGLLGMRVRVRIRLCLELLRVRFHGGEGEGKKGTRLMADAEVECPERLAGGGDNGLRANSVSWSVPGTR